MDTLLIKFPKKTLESVTFHAGPIRVDKEILPLVTLLHFITDFDKVKKIKLRFDRKDSFILCDPILGEFTKYFNSSVITWQFELACSFKDISDKCF